VPSDDGRGIAVFTPESITSQQRLTAVGYMLSARQPRWLVPTSWKLIPFATVLVS